MMNQRLYPKWTHPRYWGLTKLRQAIEIVVDKYFKDSEDKTLVDLGCGSMPYRSLIDKKIYKYVGVDIENNSLAEVLLDVNTSKSDLPDETADFVLSTQVLEHVTSPSSYLAEAYRLTKKDGMLILSTHGFWLFHPDPNDYWRWTASGLKKLLEDNGWQVKEVIGVLGFSAAALCLLQDAIAPKLPRPFQKIFTVFMQGLVGLFDSFYSPQSRKENSALYLVVATKKA